MRGPPSLLINQPLTFAGELVNWFMNWFGELAVRSVSEFALDASPWLAASVRSFALGPKYARTLALVRELALRALGVQSLT